MAASGDEVAVPVVSHHAVAGAHFLAADAMEAPRTRALASGAGEARSAHAVAGLWVTLATVSTRKSARLTAVGTELTMLARPVAPDAVPSYQKAIFSNTMRLMVIFSLIQVY